MLTSHALTQVLGMHSSERLNGVSPPAKVYHLLLTLLSFLPVLSHATHPPVQLFTISRSTNSNVVSYDARLNSDGQLDLKDPLEVYWLMHAERGQREELTWFEKNQAYGFSVIETGSDYAIITIRAFEKKPIRIFSYGGVTEADMEIAQKSALLQGVFVKTTTGLIPGVEYIELKGIDRTTGKLLTERITP